MHFCLFLAVFGSSRPSIPMFIIGIIIIRLWKLLLVFRLKYKKYTFSYPNNIIKVCFSYQPIAKPIWGRISYARFTKFVTREYQSFGPWWGLMTAWPQIPCGWSELMKTRSIHNRHKRLGTMQKCFIFNIGSRANCAYHRAYQRVGHEKEYRSGTPVKALLIIHEQY